METPQITPNAPLGLAFDISDLMLLQGWAEFHEVQMVVDPSTTVLPHIQSGRVRAIAVTSSGRSAKLPDVPTTADQA